MVDLKQEYNMLDEEFIIKMEDDEENSPVHMKTGGVSSGLESAPIPKIEPELTDNVGTVPVRPATVPIFMPKSEPEYLGSNSERIMTVPAPMLMPKLEPDMVDKFIIEPTTDSVAPGIESNSTSAPQDDIIILSDEETSVPGPNEPQTTEPGFSTQFDKLTHAYFLSCVSETDSPEYTGFLLENKASGPNVPQTSKNLPGPSEPQTRKNLPGPSEPKTTKSVKRTRNNDYTNFEYKKVGEQYLVVPKLCGVRGCGANTNRGDDFAVFNLPLNYTRRAIWLQKIDRVDLLDKKSNSIHVCEKHFNESDIINTAKRKMLKNTAVPVNLLPNLLREHKGVQAKFIMFDNCSQTDHTNMESKAVQFTTNELSAFNTNEVKKLIAECKKRLKNIENGAHKTQIHAFNNWCDKFLPDQLAEIVKGQATLKFHNKGNRYDLASKALSLSLYYTSKPAYDLLCKEMCLPHNLSVKRTEIPISTEYNEDIMKALKMKVDNMSEREKYCSVIIDLMKLRASLGYIVKKDRIVGLHDVNGRQSMEPAQYALVIFARGLFVNWSQPIAFALLSETKNHSQISEWIDMYLTKLLDIGLKIKTFVPTIKSDLLNEAQHRSVSVDKPYFFINCVKIYYFLDVPDLLKELRDAFLDYNFQFQRGSSVGMAAVKHVTDLLQHDLKKNLRLAPKLTLKHLYPKDAVKNQVRYAAQLLSRSVATALEMRIDFDKVEDEKGRDTVDFLLLMNNLFDTLNSSSIKGQGYKKAFCGDKTQIDLLQRSLEFFQTLQIFTGNGKKRIIPKFIENFQITISSVLLLFEDLKQEGHEYLFTRHLHLEASKKFFKAIKTKVGMVVVPTSKQFLGLFRGLYLTHILKPSEQRNCSRDLAKFLFELNETEEKSQDKDSACYEMPMVDSSQLILQSVSDATVFFAELKVAEENNVSDICKILLKGCLKHHKNCKELQVFVDSFNAAYGNSDNNDWEMHTLETISPVYFVSFIEKLEKEFCDALEMLETNSNISMAAYEKMKDMEFVPPCPCFPTNYLKALFIRLRIYIIINYNNSNAEHIVIPKLTCIYT